MSSAHSSSFTLTLPWPFSLPLLLLLLLDFFQSFLRAWASFFLFYIFICLRLLFSSCRLRTLCGPLPRVLLFYVGFKPRHFGLLPRADALTRRATAPLVLEWLPFPPRFILPLIFIYFFLLTPFLPPHSSLCPSFPYFFFIISFHNLCSLPLTFPLPHSSLSPFLFLPLYSLSFLYICSLLLCPSLLFLSLILLLVLQAHKLQREKIKQNK